MTAGVVCAVFVVAAAAVARAARRRSATYEVVARLGGRRDGRATLVDLAPPAPRWFVAALDDAAFDRVPPDAAFAYSVVTTAAIACAAAFFAGPVMGLVTPLALVAGAAGARRLLSGRGDRRYEASLPLALELVARSLRSGASLHQAIAEVSRDVEGAVGHDLRAVADRLRLGTPLVSAIDDWAAARPLAGVRLAASALSLGAEAGGAQARAIDGVAATLRERVALAAEVRALTSQPRTSAVVIAAAPVAFCALTAVADPRQAEFLFRTPLGIVLLLAGLALDGAAVVWMHALTKRVTA